MNLIFLVMIVIIGIIPKPKTQNPKPKTQNPDPKPNPKSHSLNPKP